MSMVIYFEQTLISKSLQISKEFMILASVTLLMRVMTTFIKTSQ